MTSEEERPLETAVGSAKASELSEVKVRLIFHAPKTTAVKEKSPELGHISYWKPKGEIAAARKKLQVSTAKQVGEKTFEYFYKQECED
jgi:hypothetical protein